MKYLSYFFLFFKIFIPKYYERTNVFVVRGSYEQRTNNPNISFTTNERTNTLSFYERTNEQNGNKENATNERTNVRGQLCTYNTCAKR